MIKTAPRRRVNDLSQCLGVMAVSVDGLLGESEVSLDCIARLCSRMMRVQERRVAREADALQDAGVQPWEMEDG